MITSFGKLCYFGLSMRNKLFFISLNIHVESIFKYGGQLLFSLFLNSLKIYSNRLSWNDSRIESCLQLYYRTMVYELNYYYLFFQKSIVFQRKFRLSSQERHPLFGFSINMTTSSDVLFSQTMIIQDFEDNFQIRQSSSIY